MLLHHQKEKLINFLFFYKKFVSFFFLVGVIEVAAKLNNTYTINTLQIIINNNISSINDIISLYIRVAMYVDSIYANATIGVEIYKMNEL